MSKGINPDMQESLYDVIFEILSNDIEDEDELRSVVNETIENVIEDLRLVKRMKI